jgi:hypothetical protein
LESLREYGQENQPIHPDEELQARSKKGFMAGQGRRLGDLVVRLECALRDEFWKSLTTSDGWMRVCAQKNEVLFVPTPYSFFFFLFLPACGESWATEWSGADCSEQKR